MIVAVSLFAAEARAQQRELRVAVSSAQLVNFRAAARSVFIADPAIADIQVASPDSVIVFGRKPGQTTLIAMGANDKPLANIQVVVSHSYARSAAADPAGRDGPGGQSHADPERDRAVGHRRQRTMPPRKSPRRRSAMPARRMSSSTIWRLPGRPRLICGSASPRSSAA